MAPVASLANAAHRVVFGLDRRNGKSLAEPGAMDKPEMS
jgi:hypothetical protein